MWGYVTFATHSNAHTEFNLMKSLNCSRISNNLNHLQSIETIHHIHRIHSISLHLHRITKHMTHTHGIEYSRSCRYPTCRLTRKKIIFHFKWNSQSHFAHKLLSIESNRQLPFWISLLELFFTGSKSNRELSFSLRFVAQNDLTSSKYKRNKSSLNGRWICHRDEPSPYDSRY